MSDIDVDRLIWVVTGIHLRAELGDRPLAYRVEREIRARLAGRIPPPPPDQPPQLAPAVVSDVFYLNNQAAQARPTISIGGPGVNGLSALLVDRLPAAVTIEDTLVIQMDLEMKHTHAAVWGMNHLDTMRAVELFVAKGYLDRFIQGVVGLGSGAQVPPPP